MRNIELLSPCGDFERLKLALKFGADAVYLAGEMFGMRTNPSNFSADELKKAGVKDVKTGIFGADMKVDLLNDGPVTIIMDSE